MANGPAPKRGQLTVPRQEGQRLPLFPSLYRASSTLYKLCDPEGGAEFTPSGAVSMPQVSRWGGKLYLAYSTVGAFLLAAFFLLIWDSAISVGSVTGALVLGTFGGLAFGVVPTALTMTQMARQTLRDRPVEIISVNSNDPAWTLCELADRLANSPSWRDRTIDPSRRVPAILWSAVTRLRELDRKESDARKAQAYETLRDVAAQTFREVEQARAAIGQVEANLREVLTTAQAIDKRRAEHQARQQALEARRREETELRTRLMGTGVGEVEAVTEQADVAEGLAAETAAISELLADSDRMLHSEPA